MKAKSKIFILFSLSVLGFNSCTKELVKMNENPNGVDPSKANTSLVLTTVLTESFKSFINLGYLDIAGVMQHTQKDGWEGGHNSYDWGGSNDWSGYYNILRNNKFVYEKAVATDNTLQQGITLVMKSLMFGLITDLWGDAPYSKALMANEGGVENKFPVYDGQQNIYEGILADLETANTLLSQDITGNVGSADVIYNGSAAKWRKFANSLALRYYMRLSERLPSTAKQGIEKIVADPIKYPIILNVADDAAMSYPGNNNGDSWPANATYDTDSTNYRRIKMSNTFVTKLLELNDPRIAAYANKVQIFLHVDASYPPGTDKVEDTVVNGEVRLVRKLSPDALPSTVSVSDLNQNTDYVGLPLNLSVPYAYNLSTDQTQSSRNPHVSWVNSNFANAKSGIKARVLSASEVHFILAEASAVYGWNAGDAEDHYKKAVQASFAVWNVGSADSYLEGPGVAFEGTQEQIITQKWIASWSVAAEAWFDWRRTGYPVLQGTTQQGVLPVRFYYPLEERNLNTTNVNAAIQKLELSPYNDPNLSNGKNGIWSQPWIIQETGKPW